LYSYPTRLSSDLEYFDFREKPYPDPADGICLIDVIEHIYPSEESGFLANLVRSVRPHGIALFGTPNLSADQYASPNSKVGHVNLKDHKTLRLTLSSYFHNIFVFSMNDEVLHTGFYPMAHYLWALCASPKRSKQVGNSCKGQQSLTEEPVNRCTKAVCCS